MSNLRRLNIVEIEKLAGKAGVCRVAVENFLVSITNNENNYQARQNLALDTRLYNWNVKTVKAIVDGIDMVCKRASGVNDV